MDYIIEKEKGRGFVTVKELKNVSYHELKVEVETLFGRCSITSTSVDSNILWARPHLGNETYRITCLGKE